MPDSHHVTGEYGYQVEDDVRQAAAQLGVADFVYTVPVVPRGGGTREIGDAILFSNGMGAILQVKSREPGARAEDGTAWIKRRGGKAYRQGLGTRRMIQRRQDEGAPVVAYPLRADDWDDADRELAALGLSMDVSDWPVVIILDHPGIDGIDPPDREAFWITTADWLELNRALRSVTALLTYVRRALEASSAIAVPLGSEQERFRQVLEADSRAADGGVPSSRPWLTADSLRDPIGVDLYKELLTRLWPSNAERPHVPIEQLRKVLEFLDALPPGSQASVGRWILRKRAELRSRPSSSGAVMWGGERLLVFGCSRAEEYEGFEQYDAHIAMLAAARSRQVREQGGRVIATLSVGHLVADGSIDYRYVYAEPPLDIPDELSRIYLHRHGRLDLPSGRVEELYAGRNDLCPCGSGRKFKHCDGSNKCA